MFLPKNVLWVLNKLNDAGYEAYVVGGAVRDAVMGIAPHDYDVTTSATPADVKAIFPDYFALGEKFGTISVVTDGEPIEVTTFRKETDYSDGRHPDTVEFVTSVFEDLKRRDFTMNAIAYNPSTGFVDPFNGIEDINDKIIRCVNNPIDRFTEDGLRIVRAIRFAAKFGFKIEKETLLGAKDTIDMLDCVASERINVEFVKILTAKYGVETIRKYPFIIEKIIPEWVAVRECKQHTKWHIYDLEGHTLKALETVKNTERLKLAAFFHDIGKPKTKVTDINGFDHFNNHAVVGADMVEEIMTRLKFSKKEIKDVSLLVKYHDAFWEPTKASTKRLLNVLGDELFLDVVELRRADIAAQRHREDKSIETIMKFYNEIKESQSAISIKDLDINGKDIMELLDIGSCPKIGEILTNLLELVINEDVKNEKEELIRFVKENYK